MSTDVTATSQVNVAVAGAHDDQLHVRVDPGDFAGGGSIKSVPSGEAPVEWAGFSPAGAVREVTVTGTLVAPLTVNFDAGSAHPDDLTVVWRKDAEVGWYPIAIGDAGGAASADRTAFSPHLPGWLDPATWLDIGVRWVRGRTTEPTCGTAPDWANLTKPQLDILLSCVDINQSDGASRAELKIKNNRAIVQQIAIPDGVAYADVEGQPAAVRSLVRTVAGGDVVLLPPGTELRIGFTQPVKAQEVRIIPTMTNLALLSELVVQLAGLADEQHSMALLPAIINVAGCAGLKSEIVSGVIPDSVDAVKNLGIALFKCAEAFADPKKAIAVAQQFVAAQADVPLSVVESDASFNKRVEAAAGKVNLLGKVARALKVIELGKAALNIWETVGEELGRAVVDSDPAVVTLDLAAAAAASPTTTSNYTFAGQWQSKFSTVTINSDSTGTLELTVPCCKSATYPITVDSMDNSIAVTVTGPPTIVGDYSPDLETGATITFTWASGFEGTIITGRFPQGGADAFLCSPQVEDRRCYP